MHGFVGERISLDIYGGSHEPLIGVRLRGIPEGCEVDGEALARFMARRAPGRNAYSTPRREADAVEFLSGVQDGICTGEEIHAVIRSTNTRSRDYSLFYDIPRPSHADYVARVKYNGELNMAGGGPFSGRMTAPLCIAGSICMQQLERRGVSIGAHLYSVADVCDVPFDPVRIDAGDLRLIGEKLLPVQDDGRAELMAERILAAGADGDSVGAVIECAVTGLPIGLGGPLFEGIESRIASLAFAVPAVKGVEFGSGFGSSQMRGSEHNDPFAVEDGRIVTETNNSGGIQGGITNGMPIIFRVAFKPTPSIAKEQMSVSISDMDRRPLSIVGRHDPCVGVRAVPVVEAVAAIALYDAWEDK